MLMLEFFVFRINLLSLELILVINRAQISIEPIYKCAFLFKLKLQLPDLLFLVIACVFLFLQHLA